MKTLLIIVIMFVSIVVFLSDCTKHEAEALRLPSEIASLISDSIMALYEKGEIERIDQIETTRCKIAAGMIKNVKSKGLGSDEMLTYGNLLIWAERREEARAVFHKLRHGDDLEACNAWAQLISMEIQDENYEMAESMISECRNKYTPTPDELSYLNWPVSDLASQYNEMNKPEVSIRLYMDELNSLPFDAPYHSFGVAEDLTSLMIEADRIPECRDILEKLSTNLKEALNSHIKKVDYEDTAKQEDDPVVQEYQNHITKFELLLNRLDMVGEKAPPIKFLHVFNADSTMTMENLLGKVVLIDFWATWCLPCIEGFDELRKIYTDYHDRGLEIVGLTSFQRIYRDMDTGMTEGSDEKSLSRQREIELTESFIKKHQMIWPCAFSETSVFNPEYTVRSIPTLAILDREGRIRFIQVGCGAEQQKRRIIAKLIE